MFKFDHKILSLTVMIGLALGGCGKKKADQQETKIPPIPTPIVNPTTPPSVRNTVTRGEVLHTLTFSVPMEQALRRSNKDPMKVRAQLVQYRDISKNSAWEILELANAWQGDATTVVAPFYRFETKMREIERGRYGYIIIGDITTQFFATTYRSQEIGAFKLSDQQLNLCSGSYAALCRFDNDSLKETFDILAWPQN